MSTALRARLDFGAVAESAPSRAADLPARQQIRIATIDWMRGLVMLLMVIDHASMAFDASHLSEDSAMYPEAATMALPAAEFFTRWITHLCAPTFLFLAGTALALSIERRVAKGANAWEIDKNILMRGAIIALLDPTIVSLGSGRWTFQVLLAIGLSMMCMAPLRRLPSWALLGLGLGWFAFGELVTGWVWHPPGPSSIPAALTVATYGNSTMVIKYPLFPWLAMMVLGWVFGRHLIHFGLGKTRRAPADVLRSAGAASLVVFAIVRHTAGYGDMFLHRADNSWQQWLHVSKYPPSLTYATLELGLLCILSWRSSRSSGASDFDRTASSSCSGKPRCSSTSSIVSRSRCPRPTSVSAAPGISRPPMPWRWWRSWLLYPACLWYRGFKAAHPDSFLKYI